MMQRRVLWVAGAVLVSWLGEFVHNYFELPQLTLFSPENSLVLLVGVLLFLLWWRAPAHTISTILLFGWGLLHLLGGGILSVIPFSFWPYSPEQSLQHYLAHLVYALAQLPLLVLTFQDIQRGRTMVKEG